MQSWQGCRGTAPGEPLPIGPAPGSVFRCPPPVPQSAAQGPQSSTHVPSSPGHSQRRQDGSLPSSVTGSHLGKPGGVAGAREGPPSGPQARNGAEAGRLRVWGLSRVALTALSPQGRRNLLRQDPAAEAAGGRGEAHGRPGGGAVRELGPSCPRPPPGLSELVLRSVDPEGSGEEPTSGSLSPAHLSPHPESSLCPPPRPALGITLSQVPRGRVRARRASPAAAG